MNPHWIARLKEIKGILETLTQRPIPEVNLRTTVNENLVILNGFLREPNSFRFEVWAPHIQQAIEALQQLVRDHGSQYLPQLLELVERFLGGYMDNLLHAQGGHLTEEEKRIAMVWARTLHTADERRRQHWQGVLDDINSLTVGIHSEQNIGILNNVLLLMVMDF
jgi:hypothetical protein